MKKILYILILTFLLFSCSNETENQEVVKNIDRSSPEKVLNWYALAMEVCNLDLWINYFEPEVSKTLKEWFVWSMNWGFEIIKWVTKELWGKNNAQEIQKEQDKINSVITQTWLDKLDYNQICREDNLETTNFKILDKWKISWDEAKYKVSYTYTWKDFEEFWYLKKIWNDWYLLDDEDGENSSNESINSNDTQDENKTEITK